MKKLLQLASIGVGLVLGTMPTLGQALGGDKASVPLEEALKLQDGASVTVRGYLANAGSNYFTDQRLVIRDDKTELAVRPWLPSTTGPNPRSAGPAPNIQSEFLDQEVVLKGRVETQSVKGVGKTKVLVVEEAAIPR